MKHLTSLVRNSYYSFLHRRWQPAQGLTLLALVVCALLVAGCIWDMHDQPRYGPFDTSPFFEDGLAARPLVPGTVARGQLQDDEHFYTGISEGGLVQTFPFPVTHQVLERGQERYDIFCAPCHGRVGDGDGIIVRRGFPRPPSLHTDRMRAASVGHYYDVITNGFGVMYDYADKIPPEDRWAIVAYIRALQLSQHTRIDDLSEAERQTLLEARE